jgi:hypothetical protein
LRTYILFLIICAYGCLSQDEFPQFTSNELATLLAADSSKSWHLTGRLINGERFLLDCEKDDILTFNQAVSSADSADVKFVTGPVLCPGQPDTIIYQGYWFLQDTSGVHSLHYVVDGDTTARSIEMITSQLLRLSHTSGSIVVEEFASFSD